MPRGHSKSSPRNTKARELERDALELRKSGLSYRQIAERLNRPEETVYSAVKRALAGIVKERDECAAEVISLQLQRIDALLAGLWDGAAAGTPELVDRAIKLLKRQAELLGLDAPSRAENKVSIEELDAASDAYVFKIGGDGDP